MTKKEAKLVARAMALAAKKHGGQRRKDSSPYLYHPFQVAKLISDLGYSSDYQITAILHDIMEDTNVERKALEPFGEEVIRAVELLTRSEDQDEADYVEGIMKNRLAAVVKNADKICNLHDAVALSGKGMRRTAAQKDFLKRYYEEAKEYYYGKFSEALDKSISMVCGKLDDSYSDAYAAPAFTKEEWKLYIEKDSNSEQLEAEYNTLKESWPDFSREDIKFYRRGIGLYCLESNLKGRTWVMTTIGWRETEPDLSFWDDAEQIEKEEAKTQIEIMKEEDLLASFVEASI